MAEAEARCCAEAERRCAELQAAVRDAEYGQGREAALRRQLLHESEVLVERGARDAALQRLAVAESRALASAPWGGAPSPTLLRTVAG